MEQLRMRLAYTIDPLTRVTLAGDVITLYSQLAYFGTTKRGDELTRKLVQCILRLPNHSGLIFNVQWGKTLLEDGGDHLPVVVDRPLTMTNPYRRFAVWDGGWRTS